MVKLASIIILGVFAQLIASRTKIPAILPLILIGLLVGPLSTFFTPDGSKWLNPSYDPMTGEGMFLPEVLFNFVTLAIGVILFEGGLTLNFREVRGTTPAILKLITLGALITFIGGAIAAHYILSLDWPMAFLFSSLIIVTGPTVIGPILRHLPIKNHIAAILKWEGILIDPIGALVAILTFELILSSGAGEEILASHTIASFFKTLILGGSIGFSAAWIFYYFMRIDIIPEYLLNLFTLAWVLLIFILSDAFFKESGLLAVVIMGMTLANIKLKEFKEILTFKESISILLISILFILLSANIELYQLKFLLDWKVALLFLAIVFILRPLSVFASTRGAQMSFNEKLFISLIGPRGIVAAGIASLFGMKLKNVIEGAEYITPLVFMVVLGTVLFTSLTAKPLSRLLGVAVQERSGILIIGANKAARLLAKFLKSQGRKVILIDRSPEKIEKARQEGLEAFIADVYKDDLSEIVDLNETGYLVALTENDQVNKFVIEHLKESYGTLGHFRLLSSDEITLSPDKIPHEGLFSGKDDYFNLHEVSRQYPFIWEVPVEGDRSTFLIILDKILQRKHAIPLFIKHEDGSFDFVTSHPEDFQLNDKVSIIYLGEKIDELHPRLLIDCSDHRSTIPALPGRGPDELPPSDDGDEAPA